MSRLMSIDIDPNHIPMPIWLLMSIQLFLVMIGGGGDSLQHFIGACSLLLAVLRYHKEAYKGAVFFGGLIKKVYSFFKKDGTSR